jgi:predicted O-methyltransferase YrrM
MPPMLVSLAVKYGTDKAHHGYCEFYERHFAPMREEARAVLEIGVATGASIRTWLEYFPNARVVGFDCDPHVSFDRRVSFYTGDQADRADLKVMLLEAPGPYDLILDDGGHTMRQQQTSLAVLLPYVRPGGFYVCEDLFSSNMDEINAWDMNGTVDTGRRTAKQTTLALFRALEHGELPESDWITEPERRHILDRTAACHVHDTGGDGWHVTGLIQTR